MKSPFAAATLLALSFSCSSACAVADAVPSWYMPADSIAVISSSTDNGFPYAIVRDKTMHNHNVYCVTVGAHIGTLRVVEIGREGVLLSDGRFLRNPAGVPTATLATAGSSR